MLLLLIHRMTTKSKSPCLIYQLSNPNDRSCDPEDIKQTLL